ncbi:MAG: IS21 family transposase [Proteobacteria bacterium]|nr:IS21 family transposase [Pseudomonadota bacterium]
MEYIKNREEFEHLIVAKHSEGNSIRFLARHYKIGRNTVRRILRRNESGRDRGHDVLKPKTVPRQSKLDPWLPRIQSLLEQFPGITGVRMHEELQNAGFDGGRTIVFDRLRQLRPRPKRELVVRFETDPGQQGQMDWSPYTIPFVKGGGTKVLCFSCILGFSRRQYIDFTLDRKFFTMIRRHRDAFEYFGGVPRHCLYDGEKTVLLRWEAGRPVYNPAFVSFITHYWCRPVGCRPGRPQTKGKVEAPFNYVEKNLLNGRLFSDLADLRNKARWWLKEKSDRHLHDTTGRPPIELFLEREKEALLPLPEHPCDTAEVALRVRRCDGFLEFETNLYSTPPEYVADILTLKATETEILIYSPELELVAGHERLLPGAGKTSEKSEHRISSRIRYGLEPVKDAFLQIGEAAEYFLKGLKEDYPRNCGHHARLVLNMKERYHTEAINRALEHATRYHAFDANTIERILKAKARPRTLESIVNEKASSILKKNLPEIRQRSLDEYSLLLKKKPGEKT